MGGTSGTGAYERMLDQGLEPQIAHQLDDLIAEGYYPPEGFEPEVADYFRGVSSNTLAEIIKLYKGSNFQGVQDFGSLLISVARPMMPPRGVPAAQVPPPFRETAYPRPGRVPPSYGHPPPRAPYPYDEEAPSKDGKATGAPMSDRMKRILEGNNYKYEVTSGQRSYGPGPGYENFKPPKNSQCYFGKIPMEYLVEDLVEKFEQAGPIFHMRLMMNPETGKNQTYGFVTFFDAQTARKCVELFDGYVCVMSGKNRTIKMNVRINEPNRRLFVGPIPKTKDREDIMVAFAPIIDGITEVEIQEPADPNTTAKNKGFCFLEFSDHKQAAHAKKRLEPGVIPIKAWGNFTGYGCTWSDPLDDPDEEVLSKIKNVYITKLTESVTEADLTERFSQYGYVERVKKVSNYAFVNFAERDDCLRAIESEDGKQLKDSVMKCALAKPVPPDSKTRLQQIRDRQQQAAAMPPPAPAAAPHRGRHLGGPPRYKESYGPYADPYAYDRYPPYDYAYPSRDPYERGYPRDPYDAYRDDPYGPRGPPPPGAYPPRGGVPPPAGYSAYDRYPEPSAAYGAYGGRAPYAGPPPPKRGRGGR